MSVAGHAAGAASGVRARTPGVLARNAFPVVLVSLVAGLLAALGPSLLVADSWMTLAAGREVAQHGIPHRDALTVWSLGERWTDQQWLAQLTWYGIERLAGLRAVALAGALLVAATFASALAAARLLGATARSSFLVGFAALLVAPWSWQIRAQTLALPLFVWTVWLGATYASRPSRRVLLVLPVLVVWANVHGSVLLGACVVTIAAAVVAARGRTRRSAIRGGLLTLAAWLAALATPYGTGIVGYYRLMLVDPPFGDLIQEWERTTPRALTAPFFLLAVVTVALVVWQRRRLQAFDIVVLAVTLAGALQAIRGIVWFSLAVVIVLPRALDGAIGRPDIVKLPRANRALAFSSLAAAAAAVVVVATKPASWFEREWPSQALAAVARAGDGARVFPSDRHADWLLWHEPGLRGRLAYDVRFELYPRRKIIALSRFTYHHGADWTRAARGYDVVVVDQQSGTSLTDALVRRDRARVVYRTRKIAVLYR